MRNTMKNTVLILIFVFLGCAHNPSMLVEKEWSDEILVGYKFTLVDKNIIEEYLVK